MCKCYSMKIKNLKNHSQIKDLKDLALFLSELEYYQSVEKGSTHFYFQAFAHANGSA